LQLGKGLFLLPHIDAEQVCDTETGVIDHEKRQAGRSEK
jgi:hypothetical protein